jgi:FtsH-binding integral membrane protein
MQGILAICDGVSGSTRTLGIIIPPCLVVAWVGTLVLIFRRIRFEDGLVLFGVLLAAGGLGAFIFLYPHGVSGNGNYLARFFYSLLAAGAIGAAGALWKREVGGRMIVAAVLGDIFVPGLLILLFVWSLSLSGSCIG